MLAPWSTHLTISSVRICFACCHSPARPSGRSPRVFFFFGVPVSYSIARSVVVNRLFSFFFFPAHCLCCNLRLRVPLLVRPLFQSFFFLFFFKLQLVSQPVFSHLSLRVSRTWGESAPSPGKKQSSASRCALRRVTYTWNEQGLAYFPGLVCPILQVPYASLLSGLCVWALSNPEHLPLHLWCLHGSESRFLKLPYCFWLRRWGWRTHLVDQAPDQDLMWIFFPPKLAKKNFSLNIHLVCGAWDFSDLFFSSSLCWVSLTNTDFQWVGESKRSFEKLAVKLLQLNTGHKSMGQFYKKQKILSLHFLCHQPELNKFSRTLRCSRNTQR